MAPEHGPRHQVSRFATLVSEGASGSSGLGIVVAALALWVLAGAALGFPPWWQAVLNASGWVVALLMLFVLAHAQRKDTLAIQLKLNELVRAVDGASDRLAHIERLDHEDLAELRDESERQRRRDERERGARLPPARGAGGPAKP